MNLLSLRETAARTSFDGGDVLDRAQSLLEDLEPDSEEAHRFSGVVSHLYDLSGDNRLDRTNVLATLDRLQDAAETSIVPGYSYFEMLSRGGEATVYRAMQRTQGPGRLVALKIAHTFKEETPAARARRLEKLQENFDNEWDVLRRFDSDRVLQAFARGRTETGKPYLVLEYMEAGSLNVYVQERIKAHREGTKAFPVEERLQIAIQMIAAIAVFHEEGLILKDVKLGNFLLNRRGQIKISDPSIKRWICGTPGHLSVETRRTLKKDVFALGTSLYILFTGKIPFDATKIYSAMFKPPVPSTFDPSIPAAVDRAVMKALAAPSERTVNAMVLLESLQKAAEPARKRAKPLRTQRPK